MIYIYIVSVYMMQKMHHMHFGAYLILSSVLPMLAEIMHLLGINGIQQRDYCNVYCLNRIPYGLLNIKDEMCIKCVKSL